MGDIYFTKGDATSPIGEGPKIICHLCNNIGKWGKGFVLSISSKWEEPEKDYRKWFKGKYKQKFELGEFRIVKTEPDIYVASIVAQKGIRKDHKDKKDLVDYESLAKALHDISNIAFIYSASLHMPRIGSGLANGKWEKIEKIIKENVCDNEIDVYIYDL